MSDIEDLKAILQTLELNADALLAKIETHDVKEALRQQTEQAIAQGVFGVPTFIINDGIQTENELFWGHDQLGHIELYLRGKDPLDKAAVEEMLARQRGIDRKTMHKE
ncbi:MAG: DsbA family protein [Marinobacterium sp.]|nr:DsbA family protein [Marinobacterium sp.]